jgi:glycerol-3-phosphate dehydrogenase (NAD(P)+)
LLSNKGVETRLWARGGKRRLTSSKENADKLRDNHDTIALFDNLEQALTGVQWVVAAVPCSAVPQTASAARDFLGEAVLISGTKGLHPENGLRTSQMWNTFGGMPASHFVALSGPNLAKEIAAGIPTSTVVASTDASTARRAQELFTTPAFRVYANDDLVGVELGGALKNVVAIAAGIGDGLGFGDNSKAALMTRAWHEMTRLAVACGARESTLFGLSGMGDLVATCVSPHSRNRTLGEMLGRGESLGDAQRDLAHVAEGVPTAMAALKLAREKGIELPVTEQICAVLLQGKSPREAVAQLMNRQGCSE